MLCTYVIFVVLEFGIYFLFLIKRITKYDYLLIALLELLLIPIYKMSPANDFAMRASIPALFILSISIARYLIEEKKNRQRIFLIIVLAMGSATPMCEINRSIQGTLSNNSYTYDVVTSFDDMRTYKSVIENRGISINNFIEISNRQFFAHGYKDKPFFRYLGK